MVVLIWSRIMLLFYVVAFLAACNFSIPDPPHGLLQATQTKILTVPLQTTQNIPEKKGTPTSILDGTQQAALEYTQPSLTQAPSVGTVAANGQEPFLCNRAAAGIPMDVTVADGTQVQAGQYFSKTWKLVNTGSCSWTPLYSVVWFSGQQMGTSRIQHLQESVPPGESVEITLDFIAPDNAGIYQSNWILQDGNGRLFGLGPGGKAPFWVKVEVIESPTNTPVLPPTSTPTPPIFIQGKVMLKLDESVNLDNGEIGAGAGSDLSLEKDGNSQLKLVPVQGSKIAIFGQQQPVRGDCQAMDLKTDPISIKNLDTGIYLCVRTNQTLPGTLRLVQTLTDKKTIYLEYLTWLLP